MEKYSIRVLSVRYLTHDVLEIRTTKPAGYTFTPGQATELSIKKPGWENQTRPFTFTSIPSDRYLEFIIKTYMLHQGVTAELKRIAKGDQLLISTSWGAIHYSGPGIFIAGGAGITPFISIFRQLAAEGNIAGNKLIFANKTREDIILENELKFLLGNHILNILSQESADGYHHGLLSKEILQNYLIHKNIRFYVCGPAPMMDLVLQILSESGIPGKMVTLEL